MKENNNEIAIKVDHVYKNFNVYIVFIKKM